MSAKPASVSRARRSAGVVFQRCNGHDHSGCSPSGRMAATRQPPESSDPPESMQRGARVHGPLERSRVRRQAVVSTVGNIARRQPLDAADARAIERNQPPRRVDRRTGRRAGGHGAVRAALEFCAGRPCELRDRHELGAGLRAQRPQSAGDRTEIERNFGVSDQHVVVVCERAFALVAHRQRRDTARQDAVDGAAHAARSLIDTTKRRSQVRPYAHRLARGAPSVERTALDEARRKRRSLLIVERPALPTPRREDRELDDSALCRGAWSCGSKRAANQG